MRKKINFVGAQRVTTRQVPHSAAGLAIGLRDVDTKTAIEEVGIGCPDTS